MLDTGEPVRSLLRQRCGCTEDRPLTFSTDVRWPGWERVKPTTHTEAERLAALACYGVMDSPRERVFDEIAALAAAICQTPIAVVNFIGSTRQFFKAEVGLGVRETPVDVSFCAHALLEQEFMLVPDAALDPRFACNPLVTGPPHIRFYAGALLRTREGVAIGTVCVLDTAPRSLTAEQEQTLRILARQVMTQLDLEQAVRQRDEELARARASEARLRLVLDTARDYVILTTDPDRRITSWSAGAEATFGWPEAEALGRMFDEIFTPEDVAHGVPEAETGRAQSFGRADDTRWHLRADGTRVFLNGSTHRLPPDAAGRPRGFLKIARNETDQRQQSDELARARAELVGSEQRFRALVDISAAAVWTSDAHGVVVEDSLSWRAYTGQSEQDWLDAGWILAVHPDDRAAALAGWHAAVATETALDTAFRLHHAASGTYRWTRVNAVPLRRPDGTVAEWVGMNTDIDDQRRGEIALKESEARFRNMADHAPVMMWVTDPSGACTYINRSWCEFTGQSETEALGYGWLGCTHPDDRALAERAFLEANATASPLRVEYRLRRADGTYRWALDAASPRFGAGGAFLGYIGSVIDIDDRREAEQRVRESEEQLRLATEAADVGFWDYDLDRDRLFWPPRVKAMFGISPDVPVSMADFYAGLHPDDAARVAAAFASAASPKERAVYDVEYRTVGKEDGVVRWVAAKGRGVFAADGRCRRALGTAIDITARKRIEETLRDLNETLEQRVTEEVERRAAAEEQLRQAQKMEAVGQLTGGLAHDFNNMLTGVIGGLDLIERNIAAQRWDRVQRYIDAANTSAQRAAALTARLLAFGRRQSLDLRAADANALVSGMEDLLHRTLGENIVLETQLASGLWPVRTDVNHLESSVLNLCINARDAMPDGGRLTIETMNMSFDSSLRAHPEMEPGDYVAIRVSDTGIGMAPATAARVFEPFFTTKPVGQGTGLGLSMVYGFTRQSGGHVRIDSALGAGTTVTLYIPRVHGEVEAGAEAEGSAPLGAGETVMIVEDDSSVRLIVLEVLEELGYEAIEAVDARSAIPILESDQRIDLLVSDVGLPGLNGRQLAEIARQARPALRILFITGYVQRAATRESFLGQGMEMMTKPFAVEALATRIRDMLAR